MHQPDAEPQRFGGNVRRIASLAWAIASLVWAIATMFTFVFTLLIFDVLVLPIAAAATLQRVGRKRVNGERRSQSSRDRG